MTETRENYLVAMPPPSTEPLICRCGHVIGQIVTVSGAELLDINGMICREVHGNCPKCSRGVHWTVPDLLLERILRRGNL